MRYEKLHQLWGTKRVHIGYSTTEPAPLGNKLDSARSHGTGRFIIGPGPDGTEITKDPLPGVTAGVVLVMS